MPESHHVGELQFIQQFIMFDIKSGYNWFQLRVKKPWLKLA